MSQGLVERQYLQDIGDAIRSKNGSSDTYTPAEMAQAISGIHTADEVVLVQKTINANGQYNASDDSANGYSEVVVNVPNSYSASDEGKVVSNGDLVAQTTKQITANGTHDTTTNNSVSVDVPNSYTTSDNGKVVVNQELVAQTSKNINANGTHDTTANNSVVIDVPNSYAAADEGKVVSGGALVGQTSRNVTSNGTYDTTDNNQVVVNVPGGSSNERIVDPVFQGLANIYLNNSGEQIITSDTKNNYLNIFEVQKSHTYVLFVGKTVSNRRRAGFFRLSISDLEQYLDRDTASDIILYSNGVWLAPYAKGTDDSDGLLIGRIIFDAPDDGVVLFGTSNNSTIAPAYCIDLT